ncbi:MMPL family transporter [Nocardioidaceae bacterium]|nr:MMPL family transporter [Nocardioidaceae bacterium]
MGTAGSAVFFAGLTVLVALTALSVIGIGTLTTMALVAATTVGLAVLIALTLLPALLGLIGERICSDSARTKRRT